VTAPEAREPAGQTPSQTAGPYWSMRLGAPGENVLAGPDVVGQRVRIEGRVLDGDGKHIEDALLELWQANVAGRYRHPADDRADVPLDPAFNGFGRAVSSFETGEYWFETIKPGRVPDPVGRLQAPHLNLVVQGRGMLNPGFTRIYFADEAEANAEDPILSTVPLSRRETLVAALLEEAPTPTYRFDVRFQGPDETVFFDA
jgi:protocatechuate 3,4-dioxygenase, alpha subunit